MKISTSDHSISPATSTTKRHPLVAIGAIFKNEAPYILEWVAYHRRLGFSRFFVADNGSTDGTTELLTAFSSLGLVDYINFPNIDGSAPQIPAYAEILKKHKKDADWIAFIDADEFVVPTDDSLSILPFLADVEEHETVGSVVLNWAIYGSSGHRLGSTSPIIETFENRSHKSFPPNFHYKSIVRTSAVYSVGENPHVFKLRKGYESVQTNFRPVENLNGIPGKSSEVVWDRVRLNHYVVKSWDEFMNRKRARGRATTNNALRSESFFESHDKNDVLDSISGSLLDATKEEVSSLRYMLASSAAKWIAAADLASGTSLRPNRAEVGTPESTPAIDQGNLRTIRGCLDHIAMEGLSVKLTGWALMPDGGQVPYFAPLAGRYSVPGSVLVRRERPDVQRAIPDAALFCGFSLSFDLSDVPKLAKDSQHVSVIAGLDSHAFDFAVPGRKEWTRPSLSNAFRGFDFISEASNVRQNRDIRTIIDVGANTGQSSLSFAKRLPSSRIYACEPVGSTFKNLVNNCSEFSNISCHRLAFGTGIESELKIQNAALSVDNRIVDHAYMGGSEVVSCVSGDQFCIQNRIDFVDYLKIDTEGYDLNVLSGFSNMLKSGNIMYAQVECGMNLKNSKHVYFDKFISFFNNYRYSIFGIYEQVRELSNGTPLRRADVVFVSPNL